MLVNLEDAITSTWQHFIGASLAGETLIDKVCILRRSIVHLATPGRGQMDCRQPLVKLGFVGKEPRMIETESVDCAEREDVCWCTFSAGELTVYRLFRRMCLIAILLQLE